MVHADITTFDERGLVLAGAKRVLAGLQQEIVTAQPEATPFGGRIAEGISELAI